MSSGRRSFFFFNELTATETFELLQKAYSNECLSRANIFEWYSKFRSGRESVDDDPRVRRPRNQSNTGTHRKSMRCFGRRSTFNDQNVLSQKIATMFSFSLPYCATIAKKEASENQYTLNYYHFYYLCTTIVLTLFATYLLLLCSGTSFHYHTAI